MSEANPTYDKSSEQACEHQDRAETIFHESMKPLNLTGDTIAEAMAWAQKHGKSDLNEIAESINGDEAYVGALLFGVLKDYLWEQAEKEAERGG